MASESHPSTARSAAVLVSVLTGLGTLSMAAVSCYPDFQFSTGTSSSSASASSGTGRPGATSSGSAGGSGSTSVASGKTTSSSSKASSSSTGVVVSGPPCDVTDAKCTPAEACCFDTSAPPNDFCAGTCPSTHLELHCASDAQCTGGKHCCAIFDTFSSVIGTACRTSCGGVDVAAGCDPTNLPACSCSQLLASYFTNNTATAPYDRYGRCN